RHALGRAYDDLGQYPKAKQHAARAAELRLAHLGPEHAETIDAQIGLGGALWRLRDEKARTFMTQVLAAARRGLGPGHEGALRAMHTLAVVQDTHEEVRAQLEELVPISERVLGPEHPRTLVTIQNLANFCAMTGDLEKARQLFERVVDVQRRDQPNHP